MSALESNDPTLARDLFESSLERCQRPSTAFNLALALRRSGEVRRALSVLRDVLAGDLGVLDAEQRAFAEEALTLTRGDLATVVVTVSLADVDGSVDDTDREPRVEVQGDDTDERGVELEPGVPHALEADPGRRTLRFRGPCLRESSREVTLTRGERVEVSMIVERDEACIASSRIGTHGGAVVQETPRPRRRARRVGLALAGVVVLGGAALLVGVLGRREPCRAPCSVALDDAAPVWRF